MIGWLIAEALPVMLIGLAALAAIIFRQRARAADKRAQEAQGYAEKRREIDDEDLGIGATDAGRIKRLHDIADRQRGGGN